MNKNQSYCFQIRYRTSGSEEYTWELEYGLGLNNVNYEVSQLKYLSA